MARLDMAAAEMANDGQGASGDGLLQLGMMCASGRSGPIDLISAHQWFNLAAHRGFLALGP